MGNLRIAVFASGGGTNLQSLIDVSKNSNFQGDIEAVISNNSGAFALERARKANIETFHISSVKYHDPTDLKDALFAIMTKHSVNLIVLAGYMKLLPPDLISNFRNRIINIHPGLLPKFGGKGMYGMNVHRAVLKSGEKLSGATVHFVDEIFDNGSILIQRTVPVASNETPESLAAKVLRIEHEILPQAVGMFL